MSREKSLTNSTVLVRELDQYTPLDASSGERNDNIDRLAKEIQRVQEEVQDASSYTPDYDQRKYAQELKDFKEKLQKAKAAGAQRSRFAFKSGRKITPAAPTATSSAIADDEDATPTPTSAQPGSASSPSHNTYNTELRKPSDLLIRTASFSQADSIIIDDQSYIHIILPPTIHDSISDILNLKHCIINMSHPSMHRGTACFPNMNIRDVEDSLLIIGNVQGAAHVTNVRNSVLVVATQQLRMHECEDADIYLTCASHPIIENCKGIRFAPLPQTYSNFERSGSHPQGASSTEREGDGTHTRPSNQWDQVDDFNWLKQEPSPNWCVLPEAERVPEETWKEIVPGTDKVGLTDILKAVGVRNAEKGRSRRGSETCGGDGF
jgi:hypothetical protein